ncbi:unnamed protein product [Mycena citricolor]|uniref:F-box domain-containing protein n=1 Tax=Mycena citricolor TaxID=2018698 RepID=A0AAD2HGL0_9AGAR|nr:unnamed protein product [Mycena citricolor]
MAPTQVSLTDLPPEILLLIGEMVDGNAAILQFMLTSKMFHDLLLPRLYRAMSLQTNKACNGAMNVFLKYPDRCQHIQMLALYPNSIPGAWPRKTLPAVLSERWLALRITCLFALRLVNLRSFVWDGEDYPADELWIVLKGMCPQLTSVSCTTRQREIPADCSLFNFDNLTEFGMHVSIGGPVTIGIGRGPLPQELLDMLILRCPNLVALTLRLFESAHTLTELDRVMRSYFPELRSVCMEIFVCRSDPLRCQPLSAALSTFLSTHPNLSHVSILPYILQADATANLLSDREWPSIVDSTAPLPNLWSFVGVWELFSQFHHAANRLQALNLTGAPVVESTAEKVYLRLQALPELKSLDVRLSSPALFEGIVVACPRLVHLRVIISSTFGLQKTAKSIVRAVQQLPRLRSFALLKKPRTLVEQSMLRFALVLLARNLGIEELNLGWLDWKRGIRIKDGMYTVTRDENGQRHLDVRERGIGLWNHGSFDRRFRMKLEQKPPRVYNRRIVHLTL